MRAYSFRFVSAVITFVSFGDVLDFRVIDRQAHHCQSHAGYGKAGPEFGPTKIIHKIRYLK